MQNIFSAPVADAVTSRINNLNANTQPKWGKMSVDQMLAHCNVTYEMVYDDIHPKPNAFKRFLLKSFVKNLVVSETPYKRSSPTAPQFIIKGDKDFGKEKARLIGYIDKTSKLGAAHFDGKESLSFGKMTTTEWNNMFYKHLDHHLTQFGV